MTFEPGVYRAVALRPTCVRCGGKIWTTSDVTRVSNTAGEFHKECGRKIEMEKKHGYQR